MDLDYYWLIFIPFTFSFGLQEFQTGETQIIPYQNVCTYKASGMSATARAILRVIDKSSLRRNPT